VGWLYLTALVGPWVRTVGPVVFGIVILVAFTGFWWFSMRFLLAGRIPWRKLLPSAVATGLCWLGMVAVFSATFSGMVISSYNRYGPIGVVFDIMSFLLAIGVVIILGAVVGIVWRERGPSFRSAFGLVVFVGLVAFQVRAIRASPFPGLRAIEALRWTRL
jgi:membrane protein